MKTRRQIQGEKGCTNSARQTTSFRPLIASSLALVLGVSVAMATDPSITYDNDGTTPNTPINLTGAKWGEKTDTSIGTKTGNFFQLQKKDDSSVIKNLTLTFDKLTDSNNTPTQNINSDTLTITGNGQANSNEAIFKLSNTGTGKGILLGDSAGDADRGALTFDFLGSKGASTDPNWNGSDKTKKRKIVLDLSDTTTLATSNQKVSLIGNILIKTGMGIRNDNTLDQLRPNHQSVTNTNVFEATFGGDVIGNITIDPSDIKDPNILRPDETQYPEDKQTGYRDITSTFTFNDGASLQGSIIANTGNNTFSFTNGNIVGNITADNGLPEGAQWGAGSLNDYLGAINRITFSGTSGSIIGNITASNSGQNIITFNSNGTIQGDILSGRNDSTTAASENANHNNFIVFKGTSANIKNNSSLQIINGNSLGYGRFSNNTLLFSEATTATVHLSSMSVSGNYGQTNPANKTFNIIDLEGSSNNTTIDSISSTLGNNIIAKGLVSDTQKGGFNTTLNSVYYNDNLFELETVTFVQSKKVQGVKLQNDAATKLLQPEYSAKGNFVIGSITANSVVGNVAPNSGTNYINVQNLTITGTITAYIGENYIVAEKLESSDQGIKIIATDKGNNNIKAESGNIILNGVSIAGWTGHNGGNTIDLGSGSITINTRTDDSNTNINGNAIYASNGLNSNSITAETIAINGNIKATGGQSSYQSSNSITGKTITVTGSIFGDYSGNKNNFTLNAEGATLTLKGENNAIATLTAFNGAAQNTLILDASGNAVNTTINTITNGNQLTATLKGAGEGKEATLVFNKATTINALTLGNNSTGNILFANNNQWNTINTGVSVGSNQELTFKMAKGAGLNLIGGLTTDDGGTSTILAVGNGTESTGIIKGDANITASRFIITSGSSSTFTFDKNSSSAPSNLAFSFGEFISEAGINNLKLNGGVSSLTFGTTSNSASAGGPVVFGTISFLGNSAHSLTINGGENVINTLALNNQNNTLSIGGGSTTVSNAVAASNTFALNIGSTNDNATLSFTDSLKTNGSGQVNVTFAGTSNKYVSKLSLGGESNTITSITTAANANGVLEATAGNTIIAGTINPIANSSLTLALTSSSNRLNPSETSLTLKGAITKGAGVANVNFTGGTDNQYYYSTLTLTQTGNTLSSVTSNAKNARITMQGTAGVTIDTTTISSGSSLVFGFTGEGESTVTLTNGITVGNGATLGVSLGVTDATQQTISGNIDLQDGSTLLVDFLDGNKGSATLGNGQAIVIGENRNSIINFHGTNSGNLNGKGIEVKGGTNTINFLGSAEISSLTLTSGTNTINVYAPKSGNQADAITATIVTNQVGSVSNTINLDNYAILDLKSASSASSGSGTLTSSGLANTLNFIGDNAKFDGSFGATSATQGSATINVGSVDKTQVSGTITGAVSNATLAFNAGKSTLTLQGQTNTFKSLTSGATDGILYLDATNNAVSAQIDENITIGNETSLTFALNSTNTADHSATVTLNGRITVGNGGTLGIAIAGNSTTGTRSVTSNGGISFGEGSTLRVDFLENSAGSASLGDGNSKFEIGTGRNSVINFYAGSSATLAGGGIKLVGGTNTVNFYGDAILGQIEFATQDASGNKVVSTNIINVKGANEETSKITATLISDSLGGDSVNNTVNLDNFAVLNLKADHNTAADGSGSIKTLVNVKGASTVIQGSLLDGSSIAFINSGGSLTLKGTSNAITTISTASSNTRQGRVARTVSNTLTLDTSNGNNATTITKAINTKGLIINLRGTATDHKATLALNNADNQGSTTSTIATLTLGDNSSGVVEGVKTAFNTLALTGGTTTITTLTGLDATTKGINFDFNGTDTTTLSMGSDGSGTLTNTAGVVTLNFKQGSGTFNGVISTGQTGTTTINVGTLSDTPAQSRTNDPISGIITGNVSGGKVVFGNDAGSKTLTLQGVSNTLSSVDATNAGTLSLDGADNKVETTLLNAITTDNLTINLNGNSNGTQGAELTLASDQNKIASLTLGNSGSASKGNKLILKGDTTTITDANGVSVGANQELTLNFDSATSTGLALKHTSDEGETETTTLSNAGTATLNFKQGSGTFNGAISTGQTGTTTINVGTLSDTPAQSRTNDPISGIITGNVSGGKVVFGNDAGSKTLTLQGNRNTITSIDATNTGTLILGATSGGSDTTVSQAIKGTGLGVTLNGISGSTTALTLNNADNGESTTSTIDTLTLGNNSAGEVSGVKTAYNTLALAGGTTTITTLAALTANQGINFDFNGTDTTTLSMGSDGSGTLTNTAGVVTLNFKQGSGTFNGAISTAGGTTTVNVTDGATGTITGTISGAGTTNATLDANSTLNLVSNATLSSITMDSSSKLDLSNETGTHSADNTSYNFAELNTSAAGANIILYSESNKAETRMMSGRETTSKYYTLLKIGTNGEAGLVGDGATFTLHIDNTQTYNTVYLGGAEQAQDGAYTDSNQYGYTYSDRIIIGNGNKGDDSSSPITNIKLKIIPKLNELEEISYQGGGTENKGNIAVLTVKDGVTEKIESVQNVEVAGIKTQVALTSTTTDMYGNSNGSDYTTYFAVKAKAVSISEGVKAIASTALTVNYDLFLANFNSLNKRMGELRDNPYSQGVWARVYGGAMSNDFGAGSKTEYVTTQGGYDYALSLGDARNHIGVALAYGHSTTKSNQIQDAITNVGDGQATGLERVNSNMVEVGVYNSYIADNGWYNDTIFKFDYIMSSFTMTDSPDLESKTNNFAMILSNEFGYRYKFGSDASWYVDPQLEVGFGYFNQSDFNREIYDHINQQSANIKATQDTILTLRGRAGLSLGKKFNTERGFASVYVGAFYEYDYIDGGNASASSFGVINAIDSVESNGRAIVNIGSNIELIDGVRMYIDVEKSFGDKQRTFMQFNLGARYSFGEKAPTTSYQEVQNKNTAPLKIEEKKEDVGESTSEDTQESNQ